MRHPDNPYDVPSVPDPVEFAAPGYAVQSADPRWQGRMWLAAHEGLMLFLFLLLIASLIAGAIFGIYLLSSPDDFDGCRLSVSPLEIEKPGVPDIQRLAVVSPVNWPFRRDNLRSRMA